MCGITGFCDFKSQSSIEVLKLMTSSLAHRGPDDSGTKLWSKDKFQLGFGHTRLSIIDIGDTGHQPMFSQCGNYCIVYNGEVYNYKELRRDLALQGFEFKTNSDTEVILNQYIKSGKDFLLPLRGMFAIAIVDFKKNELIFARDRVGIKPLYYYLQNNLLLFASELKSIVSHPKFTPELNYYAVADYLKNGYISGVNSIYKNVYKLEKGHLMSLSLNNSSIVINKYWDITDFYSNVKSESKPSQIQDELLEILTQAFKYRLVSDVPIGVFLSGGYDSSLLTAILAKELGQDLSTFTIGFSDSQYDESKTAYQVSKIFDTQHHSIVCSESDAVNLVDKLPIVYDEPFSDPSSIPTLLVSKMTSQKVKVALSADGGDENFAGYNRYKSYCKRIRSIRLLQKSGLPIRFLTNKLKSHFFQEPLSSISDILTGDIQSYLSRSDSHLTQPLALGLLNLKPSIAENKRSSNNHVNPYDQILLNDINKYLPDNVLTKVDRASMAMGLECREPFLDHKLMEFAASIPFEFKLQNGILKSPIKSLVHRYVDKEIIDLPKKGFSPPLEDWMTNTFNEEYRYLTSDDYLRNQGVFIGNNLNQVVAGLGSSYLKYRFMWSIFVFQKWFNTWIK